MSALPRHIAIIMDGNGRWAQQRNLPRVSGHEAGVKAVQKMIKVCAEKKVEVLTLFAFSSENWGRPSEEVDFLMKLFLHTLEQQTEELKKNNIQLRFIGDESQLSAELVARMQVAQNETQNNTGLRLVIAINYSGRWDMMQAAQKLAQKAKDGQLLPSAISYEQVQNALCLADLPEPDLFIRTSGEQRISNFLLWQLAYTELYFTDTLWPDFDEDCLEIALRTYASRQRRYGLVNYA